MDIEEICKVLSKGGLVVCPTDTVYGIMGDATDESVIDKVFKVKQRPYNKPLIVLMDSYEMILDYTSEVSKNEEDFIKEFMPGLVTIILKKNDRISDLITSGMDTVAVRIPDSVELREIIKKLGRPVISTSANISDEKQVTEISELDIEIKSKIDLILDGGKRDNLSSTIVKFDKDNIIILREGIMTEVIKNKFNR